jgi:uncharacterized protein (TIGR03086 family)
MTPGSPLDQLREASEVFLAVLRGVTPEQMALPTPNDEWDVRALINHVVLGNEWAAENVQTGNAPRPSGDALGQRSPLEAYSASAAAMLAAFAEPGALERTVQMPFGEFPAAGLAGFRFVDLISHAWDLAKATGRSTDLAPELCESALAMSRQRMDGRDRTPLPFKDEVVVPADAPAADRLAGYLGKQVRRPALLAATSWSLICRQSERTTTMLNVSVELARRSGLSQRRNALRVLAGAGLGIYAAIRHESGDAQAKNKKKKKKKNKTAQCQGCPASCTFEFVQAGGGKICGIASNAPETCTPCTSSSQCAEMNVNFPHCVVEATILGLGQTLPLACPSSPPGLCTSVPACVI